MSQLCVPNPCLMQMRLSLLMTIVSAFILLIMLSSRLTSIHRDSFYSERWNEYDPVLITPEDTELSTTKYAPVRPIEGESDGTFIAEGTKEGTTKRLVLLNAYMRGGSSFTGELLGDRKNTFYMYEPLHKKGWYYLRGVDTMCRLKRKECQTQDNISETHRFLTQLFTCHESTPSYMSKLRIRNGGLPMYDVRICKKNVSMSAEECDSIIMDVCTHAQYYVTKVLRLAVDTLEEPLLLHSNLKMVHLFRDPRAIMNSRLRTGWYPSLKNRTVFRMEIESLCDKMMYDYKTGVLLAKKYPDRFRMVLFENLMSDLRSQTKSLFRFVNIEYTEEDDKRISLILGNAKQTPAAKVGGSSRNAKGKHAKDYAFWWRTYITWEHVQDVDSYCSEVVDRLGYSLFNSEDEMRNMSIPSMFARELFN